MEKVVVYTIPGCPYCHKVKALLKEKGIDFEEINIENNEMALKEMKEKTGRSTVPQVIIGRENIGGYGELTSLIAQNLLEKKLGIPSKEKEKVLYDLIIIGAGPAGMTAAVYAARKKLKTLVISQDIGGQIAKTFDIENYLGFHYISGMDLIQKFKEHVEQFNIEQRIGEEVAKLRVDEEKKVVITKKGEELYTKTIIIASGKHPRPLNVPGEKELIGRGVTYCATCDGPLFAEAEVAVIGGGNSALETAAEMEKVAKKVYLIFLFPWTADPVLKDKIIQLPKIISLMGYETLEIKGKKAVEGIVIKSRETEEVKELKVEGVFIEIGLLPNSDFALGLLETNQQGEIIIDQNCNTGVAGIFAAGDVTQVRDKQIIIAAGEGAKAALRANEYLLQQR